ncbi:MAG: NADPH-dependent F420 reductase [Geminicoccaceae bacterium]
MKIGFIGYGSMAEALAGKWAAKHELFIGGRNKDKAKTLADGLSARGSGTEGEAVGFGDVIVLATRHEHVFEAIETAGGAKAFAGKTVIDINNPVSTDTFMLQPTGSGSLAQSIQMRLPEAQVVKAFNMCQARVWAMPEPVFDGRRLQVFICGDNADAKDHVRELVGDVGCETIDLGGLAFAPHIEHAAAIVIKLLFGGRDPLTVLNLVDA